MTITPHKEGYLLAIPETLGGGNFAQLSAFPGYSKWQDRNCIFRNTGANIQHVLNNWPDAKWIGGCDSVRTDYLAFLGQAEDTINAKTEDAVVDDTGYRYQRKPMEHQRKAFALSRDRKAFGYFMEQGTGKTKVVIDNACYLFQQDKIDALVIIAWPNGVHRNWVEYELPVDMSSPYIAESWSGNHQAVYRQKQFNAVLEDKARRLKVFAFNVEAFSSSKFAQDFLMRWMGRFRTMLVVDQSASIKNPKAKCTKFLVDKISALAAYRRVLDGAPVAEGADELYSQFKFLDPRIIGHDTWTGFKAEFCEIGYFNEIKGYKNVPELRRRIDGHCYRVLADDCLDLPPRIYKRWPFDLGEGERRIFDELKTLGLTFFKPVAEAQEGKEALQECGLVEDSGEVTGRFLEEQRALVKNLRLQQISSGWWPEALEGIAEGVESRGMAYPWEAEYNVTRIEDTPSRLKALLLLLSQAQGKALIFSRFRADLEILAQTLGDKAVSYHGGIKDKDRDEAKRQFMNNPKVLYFLGQPRSAGIGHTLTAAKHVIFYSNDQSLRMREECEKRAHRTGLKTKLVVWDLIARGTHDGKIVRSLREKKILANVIMQDPDNFFLQESDE